MIKGKFRGLNDEEHTPQLFEENANETETRHDDSIILIQKNYLIKT